jgi:hypothetical protein
LKFAAYLCVVLEGTPRPTLRAYPGYKVSAEEYPEP